MTIFNIDFFLLLVKIVRFPGNIGYETQNQTNVRNHILLMLQYFTSLGRVVIIVGKTRQRPNRLDLIGNPNPIHSLGVHNLGVYILGVYNLGLPFGI